MAEPCLAKLAVQHDPDDSECLLGWFLGACINAQHHAGRIWGTRWLWQLVGHPALPRELHQPYCDDGVAVLMLLMGVPGQSRAAHNILKRAAQHSKGCELWHRYAVHWRAVLIHASFCALSCVMICVLDI
jgi:hypothetical protein